MYATAADASPAAFDAGRSAPNTAASVTIARSETTFNVVTIVVRWPLGRTPAQFTTASPMMHVAAAVRSPAMPSVTPVAASTITARQVANTAATAAIDTGQMSQNAAQPYENAIKRERKASRRYTYSPPVFGIIAPSSATHSPPESATSPQTAHTVRLMPGEPA